jgi:hypothetical protein
VLEHSQSIFVSSLKNNSLHASYDIWHAHLGHVSHSVISLLNKKKVIFLLLLYCPLPTCVFLVRLLKVTNYLLMLMINVFPMSWTLFIMI